MGRKAKELGPLAVSRLASPGLHFVGGVAGLALQVNQRGARSWVLRVQVGDKRRDHRRWHQEQNLCGSASRTPAGKRNHRLLPASPSDLPCARERTEGHCWDCWQLLREPRCALRGR